MNPGRPLGPRGPGKAFRTRSTPSPKTCWRWRYPPSGRPRATR